MSYKLDIPANAPCIWINVLEGGSVRPYSNFQFVLSGELAQKFTESYKVDMGEIRAQHLPHASMFTYDKGNFDDYEFPFTLFPGCMFNSQTLESGAQIHQVANALANLAKSPWDGSKFNTPPLCMVRLGGLRGTIWWQAKGFFISSSISWKGAYDEDGRATIVDVSLTLKRHFGGYDKAADPRTDLTRVTCSDYVFSG